MWVDIATDAPLSRQDLPANEMAALNAQSENLASENVDEPIPPHPPVEPIGQDGPMATPTNEFMTILPTLLSLSWKPIPKTSEMFPL